MIKPTLTHILLYCRLNGIGKDYEKAHAYLLHIMYTCVTIYNILT